MPDVCRAYEAYEAYEVLKGLFFKKTAGANAFCRMGYELLPPPMGRSPSLEEGGLWASPVKASGLAVDCI